MIIFFMISCPTSFTCVHRLGATSYNVYVYELEGVNVDLVTTITIDGTMTTVTSLKAGTPYRVQIRSIGENEVESTESRELELITSTHI